MEASSTDMLQAEQPELTIFECKLPFISDGIHKLNLNGSNFLNFVCSSPVPKWVLQYVREMTYYPKVFTF